MRNLIIMLIMCCTLTAWAQSPQQTAGIYYAYPGPKSALTPTPEGYTPFYISHYGRHGSRWITDDYRYTNVYDAFDTLRLTPLGEDVRQRLVVVLADAIGRSGSLSPVGERQHRDIAARMHDNFSEVFAGSSKVMAISSTSLRCAMSMSYFTESLKERNPALYIQRTAYPKDMDVIAYTSAAGKEFTADTAAWRKDYWHFVNQTVHPERLMASLFVEPERLSAEEQLALTAGLYWIASDMQDVDLDLSLYDIFEYDELLSYWRCINARMYACNGDAQLNGGIMVHCADNLLHDIITNADAAINRRQSPPAPDDAGVCANLRFGHDTHLLRLLARMGIEGATAKEADMYRYHLAWRDYELSPMAANLQMIFYSNADGDVLVKFLLNENEVGLPALPSPAPYYRWQEVKELWE